MTHDLEPTYPPGPEDLLKGKFVLGHEEAPCWFTGMTVRHPVPERIRLGSYYDLRVLPLAYTSMWVGDADELVERIPVLPDGRLPREDGARVPVMIRHEEGALLEVSLLRVDRKPSHPSRSLSPVLYREVWVVGDYTVRYPAGVRRALMGTV